MKMQRFFIPLFFFLFVPIAFAADWATNLVWDGGGVWTKRLPVSVENLSKTAMIGKPVGVELPDNIPTKELRVTKSDGTELLFGLTGGLTPDGGTILIPVEADPGQKAEYFIYFGNETAEKIPDMLDAKPGLLNGDVELGAGVCPDGWFMDDGDSAHKNSWTDENPRSGKKCLKTVVEKGATADWTATRQSGIPVVGGAKYRFKAWVRGEDVVGQAGWFIHVGNEKNSQLLNQVRKAGDGTFDWKESALEFTVPPEADSLMLGTVLHGTGTAWFDDVSLERIDKENVETSEPKVVVGDVEYIPFKIVPADAAWPNAGKSNYCCKSTFRIVNASDKEMNDVPVLMTLRGTQAHGLLGSLTDLSVDAGGSAVSLLDADNFRISCKMGVPAKTIKYFNVFYRFDEGGGTAGLTRASAPDPAGIESNKKPQTSTVDRESDTAHPELQKAVDPFAGLESLVKNGGFETGFSLPDDWNRNDTNPQEGVKYSLEKSPEFVRFGKQCLRLDVEKYAPTSWRGWTQRIEVEPNHTYLVQGWMKGIDLESARIHLHFHTADGKHCENGAMSSINQDISGTTDWTRVAEVITTPPDAKFLTLHLTMNGHGTVMHDNILVVDGLFAEQVDRDSRLYDEPGPVAPTSPLAWQVPAVMKVFPQTIPSAQEPGMSTSGWPAPKVDAAHPGVTASTPPPPALAFSIESARNEKEPLQLALRSSEPGTYRLKVSAPELDGFKLDRFEINTVGYVRIDYPSNYYNTKTPKWYRKSPTSAPGCDGWAGLWPDPLLPGDTVNLKPNQTESCWITWSIPKDAPTGTYLGKIELLDGDKSVYKNVVDVKVRDFALPDENHVSAIYDVRLGPSGEKYWGDPIKKFEKEIVEFMTADRLSPDGVSPSPTLSFNGGKPVFDWTEFDKKADRLFNEQKVRRVYMPMIFYVFGWGHPPKDFYGEKPYPGDWPFKGADFSKIRPEYKEKYQAALREFWKHVTEKGWADKFVLYVSDEPNYWTPEIITQMQAVCEMIHEVDPKIPIYSSTWRYVPEWSQSLNVWGIGHYGIVPVDTMKQIKADGSRIWFTTDGMLCLDTPYNAIERLLPYYCFKYGADAYEFWGAAWLTYDPFEYGSHAYIHQSSTPGEYYWVRYPNGDGYLLYPPTPGSKKITSSVRFEQAREGVEDFEYFYMLAHLIETAKKSGKDFSKAEAALEAARSLVDSPCPIGRYSSKILPNPHRVYEIRRQVADAIESLK